MPGIGNNLYPPIIPTYQKAFVRTAECRIYFSLSSYNSIEDIQNVQVIINNQNNNLSAFDYNLYPAGIKVTNIRVDNDIKDDNKYYIVISPNELVGKVFELNQFYKVQLRFTGVGASAFISQNQIANWLVSNQNYFSEWSTVCLIRGIQQPVLYLKRFTESANKEVIFGSEVVDVIGSLYFEENSQLEKETLKSYEIIIFDNVSNKVVYFSGEVYTNVYNPNEINYTLKTSLKDANSYTLKFRYTTLNEYSESFSYKFIIIQNAMKTLDANVEVEADNENGRMKVNVVALVAQPFFGNLIIRRTSNESNYTIWEDAHCITITDGKPLNYTWYDYTAESGVFYKYGAQRINAIGTRGNLVKSRYPVMLELEDIFLTNMEMQLRVRYNPEIQSFKTTFLESKTDTIGSKFPFIKRNGNVAYRQFPISGLICSYCDEFGIFINRDGVYKDSKPYYDDYNNTNMIPEYQDHIYERKFREIIMTFLHEDNVKLFRSNTEGNILVKLMDISFTPNKTLGRMLYTFSATAYEIDVCSLPNYEKYKIQIIDNFNPNVEYKYTTIGQVRGIFSGTGEDIMKVLQAKYDKSTLEGYVNEVVCLKWVRMQFESAPYLIKTLASGEVVPFSNGDLYSVDTANGYIVYINGKGTVVSPRAYYELMDSDTEVTSIYFPIETEVIIDYEVEILQKEDLSKIFKTVSFFTKIGQVAGIFGTEESIFNHIYMRYSEENTVYKQQLLSLNRITIESEPGTLVYIKDSFDDDFYCHEIGASGVLNFYKDDTTITGFFINGIRLSEMDEGNKIPREREYMETGISVSSAVDVLNPEKHGVYSIGGNRMIYYNGDWYDFGEDNIVRCPMSAQVDYICEVMKGEY